MRALFAHTSYLHRVPENMDALEVLWLEGCRRLSREWLPASSCERVTTVHAASSNMIRLPPGMCALSCLDVRKCRILEARWLPLSSTACMRELRADERGMQTLGEGATALRAVLDTTPVNPTHSAGRVAVRCDFWF